MPDPSPTLNPPTAPPPPISSPGSGAGPTPLSLLAGPQADLFGPAPAPASRSARLAADKALAMRAISGPPGSGSSASAALQRSLESRLRASLAGRGSPLYALTWKHWAMPWGPPICALRASGRRRSANGCTGWPSPNAMPENRGGLQTRPEKAMQRRAQGHMMNLDDAATLAGQMGLRDQVLTTPGPLPSGSPASTGSSGESPPPKRVSLNPAFSRWLMGYPPVWDDCGCAATAMPSSRKSRRRSSEPS
jgi:hypothetical protein